MNGKSLNITEEKLDRLKELLPEAFSEGKVDWEKLRVVLNGGDTDFKDERYHLNWAGKTDAFRVLQSPTTATLYPCRGESMDFDGSENLFIEGENLEALKILQKSYFGKVRMIYIDPPYNTGNDHFIYPDRFAESKDAYLKRIGDKDEQGRMTREGMFRKNSRENGHFHSNWLSMIYPRLFLARNLLRDDGVIFVSIDDNEVHNLRMVMNEIFGEENFVEAITWNKRIPKNDKGIGNIHEYILIYVVNSSIRHEFHMPKDGLEEINTLLAKLKRKVIPLADAEREVRKLYSKKGYDRGITLYNALDKDYRLWGKINVSWPNAETFGPRYDVLHPITKVPVKVPDRGWRWKKETFEALLDYDNCEKLHDGTFRCGKIWFDKDENTQPSSIKYLDEIEELLLRSIVSKKSDGGVEVEKLFGAKNIMSYPKPTSLLKLLLSSISQADDIVMDFFAGSCTTAHAVLQLNAEDGGNRRFICIQMPEPCDEKSEAYKSGYRTIADIGKERIRRVIRNDELEDGFKVFKLQRSSFKTWRGDQIRDEKELEKQLKIHITPLVEGVETENVLYELLLKSGLSLTCEIENKGNWFLVRDLDSTIALALENINEATIKTVLAVNPQKLITLDHLFQENDQLKTNTALQMEDADIEFQVV